MDCTASRIPYRQTNAFSKIVLDYIDRAESLKPFYTQPVSVNGIAAAIDRRKNFKTNRAALVQVLMEQYKGKERVDVTNNIQSLLSEDTFTITTAHQNNIFTGPLYFIYKIIHAIKLADHLRGLFPEKNFIPVFYMGSEDADLEELNHIYLAGEKLEWKTDQKGAVGKMKIDKALLALIGRIEGELGVLPYGKDIIDKLKLHYREGKLLQEATFDFIDDLFSEYGLLVLIADHPQLKKQMIPLFYDDLLHQRASGIVIKAGEDLSAAGYNVQAHARDINLFYLKDNIRERIEKLNDRWKVVNTDLSFDQAGLITELNHHPERFSPNVILRGLFQETILPDIAFIGGGGETAYWLQLKNLFEEYKVPFPVLVLRNSFLIIEEKWKQLINQLDFEVEDFFSHADELLTKWVSRTSTFNTKLNGSLAEVEQLYEQFKNQATRIDSTLEKHVVALKVKTVYRLLELEKKMLRAEKRKFADQRRQINKIKTSLFPKNGLQERIENCCYYYAMYGSDFIKKLYEHSPALEQEFTVLQIKK